MERPFIRSPLLLFSVGTLLLLFTACASSKPAEGGGEAKEPDEEMVDVGYGQQKKGDVTGSVSTVNVEEAKNARPVAHVSDLLRGRVSGVVVTDAPGGGIVVRIRGASSIYGNSDPLYVVDDVPVMADPGGSLSFINPHDIQSISVLKDASATAIYGSRGANGVIVIKTKRGRD